ncbi:MAG: hypothetical protein AB3N23_13440 [Paracoccaceae bacterium]
MSVKTKIAGLMCATALVLGSAPAWAEDKTGENAAAVQKGDAAQGAVAQAAMAQDLFAYAVEKKNALSALTAAQIMLSLDIADVEREKETKDNEGEAVTEEGEGVDTPIDAAAMLAAAREFAGGDESVLGLIENV